MVDCSRQSAHASKRLLARLSRGAQMMLVGAWMLLGRGRCCTLAADADAAVQSEELHRTNTILGHLCHAPSSWDSPGRYERSQRTGELLPDKWDTGGWGEYSRMLGKAKTGTLAEGYREAWDIRPS
jgi:hypothetical protein